MNAIFLPIRALHVVCAALWVGSAAMLGLFVMPAINRLGPDAGKVVTNLQRAGLNAFMASIGGLTILSGFYLYWHFTAGFDPTISGSTEGIVFSIGGFLGLVAVVLGGSVVGRGARKLEEAGAALAATTDPTKRTALLADITRLQSTVSTFGHVVLGLLVVTTILMAVAHYV
jgi:putative copper export protein